MVLRAGGLVVGETEEEKRKRLEREKRDREVPTSPISTTITPHITGPRPGLPGITDVFNKETFETFRGRETGRETGATIPGFGTVLGLSGSDIALLKQQQGVAEPAPVGTAASVEALSRDLGKIVLTGDPIKDRLSYEQAFKSALAVAGPSAIGAATLAGAGALAGGVTAPLAPFVAAGAGLAGGIVGLIAGMRSNLKAQRADIVKGEGQNLMKTEQNMLKQVMLMNQLPRLGGTTDDMVDIKNMFDEQMAFTDENHRKLNAETHDEESKWLAEDGHKQLEKYSTFNSPGGMREILIKQMTLAMNSPDLGRIAGLQAQVQTLQGEIEAGEL